MRSDSLKGYGFDFEDSVLEEEEENWGGCSFEIQRKEVEREYLKKHILSM